MDFYRCNICGKIVWIVKSGVVDTICCGNKMEKLVPNSVGTEEKHMPDVKRCCSKLVVSLDDHPFTDSHHIEWIALETDRGMYFKMLEDPYMAIATFEVPNETAIAVYLYCNLHGLWMKKL